MLASQRLGMPSSAIQTHAGVLATMQYTIKTTFGISTRYIQSTPGSMLFGTGQGSGASPAIWLMISTVLLTALSDLIPRGMYYMSPDQSTVVNRYSDAFVDDTQNGLTDAHLRHSWSVETLLSNLQEMAQTWEKLLFSSGGALELSKCSYYLLLWKWVNGLPVLTTINESSPTRDLILTSGESKLPTTITRREFSEPHKTLGVWMCPNGDETAQINYLRSEANKTASLIATSKLTKTESLLAYKTFWIPSVTYSLGTTTMTKAELRSIQSQATSSFLQKMGFNKHYPRAVSFGPECMGGLGLKDLYVEQGVSAIMLLMGHLYYNTEPGKMIRIALDNLQMEAGTSDNLLYDPTPSLPYISHSWLTTIRDFLREHQLQLQIDNPWNFKRSRINDLFLMDTFRRSGLFSIGDMKNLNAVRLHLQVATLSDVVTADGKYLDTDYLAGRVSKQRRSPLSWIRQPEITATQQALWTHALVTTFSTSSGQRRDVARATCGGRRLRTPLGNWHKDPHQKWLYYWDSVKDVLISPVTTIHARSHPRHAGDVPSHRNKHYFLKEFSIEIGRASCRERV